jgi:hypothetical protein
MSEYLFFGICIIASWRILEKKKINLSFKTQQIYT